MIGTRFALSLRDDRDLQEGIRFCQTAEKGGFEAVWQAESSLTRDAVVPMAAIAARTSSLKIGSGVINVWPRNIGLLAATFLTLDDLAPGRILCGIGAWRDALAGKVGLEPRKPLLEMREIVEVVRRLLSMERVTFHGEFVHVTEIELDVVHGRREARPIPIYLGAADGQMLGLAGEIADGVLLNSCVPPEYNDKALQLIDEGAKKAGRRVEDLDRPQLIVCSVDAEREKALDRTREFLTRALAHQPQVATDWGMPEKLLHQIQGILGAPGVPDRVQRAKPLLPEELVERITASGTPLEARRKVAQYLKRGCTCPVLDPVGSDVRLLIETFAPGSGGERQH